MYSVILSDTSKKQLGKLDRSIQERIITALERIRLRPESYVIRLVGEPTYKLRIRDYRLILDIDKGQLQILIVEVGHRKNVYKNL